MATQVNCNVKILEAKQVEHTTPKKHNVYDESEDVGQRLISVRWVITQKFKNNKMIYKARLVARGFKEENLNNTRKDSPTCCKDNFHLVLSIIVSNSWIIHSLDIKSTFLQGQKIDRDVYLKLPKEAETSNIWKLNITAYDLCDAPRVWYISVKDVLMKTGTKKKKMMILFPIGIIIIC